jgi:hypothetical protein
MSEIGMSVRALLRLASEICSATGSGLVAQLVRARA